MKHLLVVLLRQFPDTYVISDTSRLQNLVSTEGFYSAQSSIEKSPQRGLQRSDAANAATRQCLLGAELKLRVTSGTKGS